MRRRKAVLHVSLQALPTLSVYHTHVVNVNEPTLQNTSSPHLATETAVRSLTFVDGSGSNNYKPTYRTGKGVELLKETEQETERTQDARKVAVAAVAQASQENLMPWPASTSKRRANNHSRDATLVEITNNVKGGAVNARESTRRRKSTGSLMTAARTVPLLICSLGNPGSTYANTLHSAGHTVINRLVEHLGYCGLRKERELGNGLVSRPAVSGAVGDWTLWQSTSYMNESGKGVRAAHAAWSKHMPVGEEGKLVIVHDELEKPLGAVTLRTAQGASAKGHNGIKSTMSVMGSTRFARIGIGIARPVSRDSDEVARYVLKKMTPAEKAKIEGCVEDVVAKLKQLEKD